jgi:sugar phosphate isomerase/epimerase
MGVELMTYVVACQDHLPPGATLVERLRNLRAYGFEAVELLGYGLLDRLPDTRSAIADAGVPVSTICAGFEGSLVHPEPAQRRLALDGIRRLLDVSEELGANGLIIAVDYGTPPLPDLRPAFEPEILFRGVLLDGLRTIGEHLRDMRTALLLEPLNRYESRALRRVAPAVALCEASGSPNIKVMYDTFHMAIEEADPVAALRTASSRLGHVHLADSNRQLPGHGHMDFAALLAALGDMGYSGAAALECGVPGDPAELLPATMKYLSGLRF